jgi:hypothetical protein
MVFASAMVAVCVSEVVTCCTALARLWSANIKMIDGKWLSDLSLLRLRPTIVALFGLKATAFIATLSNAQGILAQPWTHWAIGNVEQLVVLMCILHHCFHIHALLWIYQAVKAY